MLITTLRTIPVTSIAIQQQRHLWQYVCQAFNLVDQHRLKEVGPDRMTAEWVLKNGGGVRFKGSPAILHTNYNTLPPENTKIAVWEIDATKSTIMSIGFEHLKNCNHITRIILDNCKYLDDEALSKLGYVDKCLEELRINQCRNITKDGLLAIVKSVPHLKRLQIGKDMPLVKDLDSTLLLELKKYLPQCSVTVE